MRIKFLLSLFLLSASGLRAAPNADSATLITSALELLQSDQKAKALKLLEKAFEVAQDPESVKDAAILILEASAPNYPKREAYLRYLTSRAREHTDVWKWHQELGDHAFDRGDFQSAEESYLNAQTSAPEPQVLKYKIGWIFWNQKRRNEALSLFLDLTNDEGLRANLHRDIARLWWEIGPLPSATFSKIFTTPPEFQSSLFEAVFAAFPKEQGTQPKTIELLKQIRDDERTKSFWRDFLAQNLFFKKDPCFMIENIYGPEDFSSATALLACVKHIPHPGIEVLDRHFQKLLPEADENFVRAYAHIMTEDSKHERAANLMFGWNGFESAQSEYLLIVEKLLIGLSDDSLRNVYSQNKTEKFEAILKSSKKSILLSRLQTIDQKHWIQFEEQSFGESKPSRDFLLKKASFLAEDYSSQRAEIQRIVDELLEVPRNSEEKTARTALKNLEEHSLQELPSTFGEDFTKSLNSRISQLDRDIASYERLSNDWQNLIKPMVKERLQKNLNQLAAQIDQTSLPEGSPDDLTVEFINKKAEIRDQVMKKYEEFLGST